MLSSSKKLIIVFNGEIYNSKELKSKIGSNILKGNSDTEVIINLYEKYGHAILNELKGMFSFIIYDLEKKICFMARDRFGIKPLYYFDSSNYFLASSEIKPIIKFTNKNDLNYQCFGDFLIKGYMDHDRKTFFKNIQSLEPGTIKYVNRYNTKETKFWAIENQQIEKNESIKKVKSKLKYLFSNSINEHLESDAEIGACLSGGNDSSSIVSQSQKNLNYKLKTFTYEFEDQYINRTGELKYAQNYAKKLGLKNYKTIITSDYVKKNFDNVVRTLESPFTSLRIFGVKSLYEKVKEKKIKVILEGQGGDEMLAGYDYNYYPNLFDSLKSNELLKAYNTIFSNSNINRFGVKKIINFLSAINSQGNFTSDGTPYLYFDLFDQDFLKSYLKNTNQDLLPKKMNFLQKSQYLETKFIHLPRVLKYVDRLSMKSGIETRVPLLDHTLFTYCFYLKNSLKIKNQNQRWIWKKTFNMNFKSNLKKRTIVDPQRNWFRSILIEVLEEQINSQNIKDIPFINKKNLISYFKNYKKNEMDTSFNLMQLLSTFKFINNFKVTNF